MQVKDKQVMVSLTEGCIETLIELLVDKVQSNESSIEWLTRENQRLKDYASRRVQDDDPIKGDSEA